MSEKTEEQKAEDRHKAIMDNFEYSKRVKETRKLPATWEKMERFWGNGYWDGSSRPAHLTRHTSNELFEVVEVMLPIVTSRPPRPDCKPEPSLAEIKAEEAAGRLDQYLSALTDWVGKLQKQLVKTFHETKAILKSQEAYRDFAILGNFGVRSEFDPKTRKITFEGVDIAACFPDPHAGNIEDCYKTWFCFAEYVDIDEIKKLYGIEVAAEGKFDEYGTFKYYNAAVTALRDAISPQPRKGYSLVIKMYSQDEEAQEEYYEPVYDNDGKETLDEAGNKKTVKKSKQKYPYGKIETIVRNHKDGVVKTEANPYPWWPFFFGTNFRRRKDFWGTGDGKNIEPHIKTKNMVISNVTDNIKLHGNTQRYKLKGVKNELTNEPGKVYDELATPADVGYLTPPSMPEFSNFLIYLDNDRDNKSGMTDALRAQSKSGDSGTKTQALIAQAVGRLQARVTEFIEFYRAIYRHWAFIIRTYGPEEIVQREEDENGKSAFSVFKPREFKGVNIDIDISVLSMLPFDNYAEIQEAMTINAHSKEVYGIPAFSIEHILDMAITRDKQRAKAFVGKMQAENAMVRQAQDVLAREQAKQEAYQKFVEIAPQLSELAEKKPQSQEEEQAFMATLELVVLNKDILDSPEYQALPARIKKAIQAKWEAASPEAVQ